MSKSYSAKEVAEHKTADSGLWITIDDGVYDVTSAFPVPFPPYLYCLSPSPSAPYGTCMC